MNKVAQSFRRLLELLAHEPESQDVSWLLADVAAYVTASGQVLCLALQTPPYAHWPLCEAAVLLEPYGVALKARARLKGDGVWIFAEYVEQPEPTPFAGAKVIVLEPDDSLAVLRVAA